MKTPIFAHGSMAGVQDLIDRGVLKYPSYIWVTDTNQYMFLNKQYVLEKIGIPELTGTLDKVVVLADLDDGIYQVKGQHKVTSDAFTTYDTGSFIFVIVQTIDGVQKIRRITADEIYDYTVVDGEVAHETTQVTTDYLDANGYVTDEDVAAIIEESIIDYPEEDIRRLFEED